MRLPLTVARHAVKGWQKQQHTICLPPNGEALAHNITALPLLHLYNSSLTTKPYQTRKMHGAWRSSGATNADLVENLWRNAMLKSRVVKDAFLRVDRADYCPSAATAYQDRPQGIGHGATISAPHMHANAVESLLDWVLPVGENGTTPGAKAESGEEREKGAAGEEGVKLTGVPGRPRRVLDIGSGSGYLTHILAELAGPDGLVVGVEHIRELRDLGEGNMRKSAGGRALLDGGRVRFRMGDGRKGWTEPGQSEAPSISTTVAVGAPQGDQYGSQEGWDAIHVGAAAVKLHDELIRQLRSPGRLFIPVEDDEFGHQYIWTVDKDEDGAITKKKLYGVRYVPLTDAP
ncbi:protein-L-isoaspartate(D-aspartate) O-methyltransferase [Microdochium nivale]|nr:protein-L-isoaspartate(D-aspartate) O-methyltransferase [Microdochium nivale]